MDTYSILNERSIIKIAGEDRFKFLQGLITNDVYKLNHDKAIYACLLTPQGKYFADFFIYSEQDYFLVDIPAVRKDKILGKLNLYKLRSALTIASCAEYRVIFFSLAPQTNNHIIFADPRSQEIGFRGFILESELANITNNLEYNQHAYDLARINNFIAEGEKDLIPENSFILEYGLDKLNTVDFKKGCYVGQELVTRTHHRGVIRKQIVRVESDGNLPKLGAIIYTGEKKLGILCSSVYNKGLALIRTEDVMSLNESAEIFVENQKIKLIFQGSPND